MSIERIIARNEHLGHECSCMIDRDPEHRLCSRCLIRKRDRDAERAAEAAEIERELYRGQG
jgi:hypothetical protein